MRELYCKTFAMIGFVVITLRGFHAMGCYIADPPLSGLITLSLLAFATIGFYFELRKWERRND